MCIRDRLYTLAVDWNGGRLVAFCSGYVQRAEVLHLRSVCSGQASKMFEGDASVGRGGSM